MDYKKISDIHVISVLEGEEKEDRAKEGFKEIMAEISPNWAEDINLEIQEAEWIPNRINPKTSKTFES